MSPGVLAPGSAQTGDLNNDELRHKGRDDKQLLGFFATQVEGQNQASWQITYLYDEDGRPHAGIYRDPSTSSAPNVFALVTSDGGDVVELLDGSGSPFAFYRCNSCGSPQGSGNVATAIWSQSASLINSTVATTIALRQRLRQLLLRPGWRPLGRRP